MIISEEYANWNDSKRRVDLLGLDKQANIVVIELKRNNDGNHMDLQAIRYASMVSSISFQQAVDTYEIFLEADKNVNAEQDVLNFLDWDEVKEDEFAQDVKIILVSADFSKELTTSVIWLNNNGLDIKCVRLKPYDYDGKILVDVQQIIPLPEAEDYQVSIKNKTIQKKASRNQNILALQNVEQQ